LTQKKVKQPHGGAMLSILVLILLLLIFLTAWLGFTAYSSQIDSRAVTVMKSIVETDVIYENIFINGVKVGGMTKPEASAFIYEMYQRPVNETKLALTENGDTVYEIPFTRFNARHDINAAVEAAWGYGRGASLEERYAKVRGLMRQPLELVTEFKYDESLLLNALESIASRIDKPPVNASITRKDRQFYTTYSQVGKKLDVAKTMEQLTPLINSVQGGVVEAVIDIMEPEYSDVNFITAQSLIGSFSTNFSPGDVGRNNNLLTAANKLNDKVVYPGEIFSTNEAFGAMTYENGYHMAPVIMDGKIENGMGGGICQVSSTLYNALLYAELEIVERRNHSMKVGYADYGFDATLVEGAIDLRFKNDTDYLIFIESYIEDGRQVVVNIYGHELHSPGRTLKFINQLAETVAPAEELIVENPNLPYGAREIKSAPRNGYRYNVYKIIMEDGVEIERELVNVSYYRPVRGEVIVGTSPDASSAPLDLIDLIPPEPLPEEPGDQYHEELPE